MSTLNDILTSWARDTIAQAQPATETSGHQRAIRVSTERSVTPARLDLIRMFAERDQFDLVEREVRTMVRLAAMSAYESGRSDERDGVRW